MMKRRLGIVTVALCAAVLAAGTACAQRENEPPPKSEPARPAPPSPRAADDPDPRPRIVALGDSLTAGLGLNPERAYPALLQQRLNEAGLRYSVVNGGVSGDTSAGGLRRLDWALEGDVRVLIVALGGNDALRGLPADELRRNLASIIERAQSRDIEVILAGMEAPPNFGRDYFVAFHEVYPSLAKQYNVKLVPFLLDGVAGIEKMNQRDGIHPTAEGAQRVADNVWAVLKPVVEGHAQTK